MDEVNILIVKLSALGDIVQSFSVLDAIYERLPRAKIDWAVSSSAQEMIKAHPSINEAIVIDTSSCEKFLESIQKLRKKRYDLLFDLQGNCKSGFYTFLARAEKKIGFSLKTAREWPNVLATNIRFEINHKQNISSFYQELVDRYFDDGKKVIPKAILLKIEENEKKRVDALFLHETRKKVLICLGSRWLSKKASLETWVLLLKKLLLQERDSLFYFAWGNFEEKEEAFFLCQQFPENSVLLERYSLVSLQYLMTQVDLMIGVDSIALHLCATTKTATLALFGPTHPQVFAPLGENRQFFFGRCPYGIKFDKQCPRLRSCKNPGCIKTNSLRDSGLCLDVGCLIESFENGFEPKLDQKQGFE